MRNGYRIAIRKAIWNKTLTSIILKWALNK
jgi:hypothetical protein